MNNFEVFKIPEVAKRLRVGSAAIYALVRSGKLDSIRIGRKLFVDSTAIARFVQSGQDLSK
jgi:excisionase family DNA binding protein